MEFREDRRRKAFEENLEIIRHHNEQFKQGKYSFKLSRNDLADLSNQQYLRRYVRLVNSEIDLTDDRNYILGDTQFGNKEYPESLDWRLKGFVTPPKNQKSCGSCYAFSVVHSVEGQLFKKLNRIVELSEQQVVDCSASHGNHGCSGGSLRTTMRYLESSGGLMRESDYPYTATVSNSFIKKISILSSFMFSLPQHNKCSFDRDWAIVNISSWSILPARNENIMKAVLNEVGPIAVSINAAPKTFQLYSTGVYDDPQCLSTTVNHAMLLVGYTEDAWILKNWWGQRWGENGYMRVKRGVNMCGISNYAAYAIA